MARHPKRQELAAWLDGEHSAIDAHLETCEKCASELAKISAPVEIDERDGPDLKPALLTLLRPPDDLHERMSQRLAQRLQRREDMALLGSLLGVARETSELFLLTPEADRPAAPAGPSGPSGPRPIADHQSGGTDSAA